MKRVGDNYESGFNLNTQLERYFDQGPGATPLKKKTQKVVAAIVPSSPWEFTGVCSAWAYKDIGETPTPSTYVILGNVRSSTLSEKAFISTQDLTTPIGAIRNDRTAVGKILDNNFVINEIAYQDAPSIDIQLPFLRFINAEAPNDFRVVPILTSTLDLNRIKQMAEKLAKLKDVIYIASSDLINYGPAHKFTFSYNPKQEVEALRTRILEKITYLNTKDFVDIVQKTKVPFYGAAPIALLLETLKLKKVQSGKLLCHYKSAKNEDNFIDFASIVYNEA